jgi:hypothetical protein
MAKVEGLRAVDAAAGSESPQGQGEDDHDDEDEEAATGTRRRRRTNAGGILKPLQAADVVGRLQRAVDNTMMAAAAKRRAIAPETTPTDPADALAASSTSTHAANA